MVVMYVYSTESHSHETYGTTKDLIKLSNLIGAEVLCDHHHWLKTPVETTLTCHGNYIKELLHIGIIPDLD